MTIKWSISRCADRAAWIMWNVTVWRLSSMKYVECHSVEAEQHKICGMSQCGGWADWIIWVMTCHGVEAEQHELCGISQCGGWAAWIMWNMTCHGVEAEQHELYGMSQCGGWAAWIMWNMTCHGVEAEQHELCGISQCGGWAAKQIITQCRNQTARFRRVGHYHYNSNLRITQRSCDNLPWISTGYYWVS